jgi:hypothetical protein
MSAVTALVAAIEEVSATRTSMKKLARAAATRPNIEHEWVYEIDGADALETLTGTAREVSLGNRSRADMSIDGTLIEFKSTKAHYARPDYFWERTAPTKDSAEAWLGGDIRRMAPLEGVFVLLVATLGRVTQGEYAGLTLDSARDLGVTRYQDWLTEFGEQVRPGAHVVRVSTTAGSYAGVEAAHDALLLSWAIQE